jgi:hypothetical protein
VKKYTISILAALALGALSVGAMADPIGPTCFTDPTKDTCQGSLYALTYSGTALPDSDPANETFRIFLDIYTGFYNGGGSFLDQVAIKVSSSFVDATLFSAPTGASNWTEADGGIDANGCSGSGSGFACAGFTGAAADRLVVPHLASVYEWAFDITVANGTLFTNPLQSSIKARYVDANGDKVGALVSENITLQTGGCPPTVCTPQIFVPEPATLALLGIGLLGLGFVGTARRRI